MPKIKDLRQKNSSTGKKIRDFSRDFYQSYEWRKFREESRQRKREDHEEIIFDVYESNPEKNKPKHLVHFLVDPKQYPLCEMLLKEGKIRRATVLDHIRPIRLGGAKLSHSNVQWLTAEQHYKKTQQENKNERD